MVGFRHQAQKILHPEYKSPMSAAGSHLVPHCTGPAMVSRSGVVDALGTLELGCSPCVSCWTGEHSLEVVVVEESRVCPSLVEPK